MQVDDGVKVRVDHNHLQNIVRRFSENEESIRSKSVKSVDADKDDWSPFTKKSDKLDGNLLLADVKNQNDMDLNDHDKEVLEQSV